jgi:8-oxo-dGTP diphosphatase
MGNGRRGVVERVGVGVGVLVERDGMVLLVRRTRHGAGTWATPGGYLDPGEAPEDAAVREVREETGLEVDLPVFVALTNDVHDGGEKHNVTLWFAARARPGEATVAAPDELSAVGWFPWDALPTPRYRSLDNLLAGRTYPACAWSRPAGAP